MESLIARGLRKYYPETRTLANDSVSLALLRGELHAIVGENGAGKSTLARIIAGLERPDEGEILVRGKRLRTGDVRAAEAAGIGFVPQVSLLAPGLSVAENLALGREPRRAGLFLSARKAYVEAALIAERYGFRLDPEALVSSLSMAERRQAEIARALARGGDVIILDEPTSILSEAEADELFVHLRRLADFGMAVAFITHRVSEVAKAADRITVLRDGRIVASSPAEAIGERTIAELMTRGTPGGAFVPSMESDGKPIISIPRGSASPALAIDGVRLLAEAQPVRLEVRSGELVAVTAFAGNGLAELESRASGMKLTGEGRVLVDGKDLRGITRARLRAEILAYVPSDRERLGLCLPAAIRDNALALRFGEFRARDWITSRARDKAAASTLAGLIAPSRVGDAASSLSGGNRQRLLLARELERPRRVAVLAEPLQGLDGASRAEALLRIREVASGGSAVLVLTSSVDDALEVADRIIALYRGQMVFAASSSGARGRDIVASMAGARGAA